MIFKYQYLQQTVCFLESTTKSFTETYEMTITQFLFLFHLEATCITLIFGEMGNLRYYILCSYSDKKFICRLKV